MTIFIFNEGYGHRGVWHIANSEVVSKDIKASEREYSYEVMKYKDPYDRNPEPTGEMHVSITKYPAYTARHVPTVYCNQVSNLRAGDKIEDTYNSRLWNKPGIFIREPKFIKGNFIYEAEEPPPGPVCSRCIKKWKEAITE